MKFIWADGFIWIPRSNATGRLRTKPYRRVIFITRIYAGTRKFMSKQDVVKSSD